MSRAALYLRQSINAADGIERQRDLCRALANSAGYTVAEDAEYADNDVSASKTRGVKTQWARLLLDAKAGRFDVIIAVDLDRLLRSLRDLLTVLDTGVPIRTVNGEIDLTTPDGKFRATMLAAVAEFEVGRKTERQLRASAGKRANGVPPVGKRAFGYTSTKDGHEPQADEATYVQQAFEMAELEVPLAQIAQGMNAAGARTTTGAPWGRDTVRAVLTNPRYAAQIPKPRESGANSRGSSAHRYKMDDLVDGNWTPLVDLKRWKAVQDILRNPLRGHSKSNVQRMLSGHATCAICSAPLKSGATKDQVRTYRCSVHPHLSVKAEPVEQYVSKVVLPMLAGRGSDARITTDLSKARALHLQVKELREREAGILALAAKGLTSIATAEESLEGVRAEYARLDAEANDGALNMVFNKLLTADFSGEAWDQLSTTEQRLAILSTVDVRVKSPGKGRRNVPAAEYVTVKPI